MKERKETNIISMLLWLVFALAIGFLGWGVLANQERGLKTFLVQSGSMEPSIRAGDVVVIEKLDEYFENDVVTFVDDEGRRVTHRIIAEKKVGGKKSFSTKGDANRSGDRGEIEEGDILGKVIWTIPKLGYVINWLRTPYGFVGMIVFPAVLIIGMEVAEIRKKEG